MFCSGICIAKFHILHTRTGLITCRIKVGNNWFHTEEWFCTGVCGNSLGVDTMYKPTMSYDCQQKWNNYLLECVNRSSHVRYIKPTLLAVSRSLLVHRFFFFQLWILPHFFKKKDKYTRRSEVKSKNGSKNRKAGEERLSQWIWLVWIGANWREKLPSSVSKITAKKIIKNLFHYR